MKYINHNLIKLYFFYSLIYYKYNHQYIANILNQDAKCITELYYTNGIIFLRDLSEFIITSIIFERQ